MLVLIRFVWASFVPLPFVGFSEEARSPVLIVLAVEVESSGFELTENAIRDLIYIYISVLRRYLLTYAWTEARRRTK